jgi:hypothetical protein
MDIIKGQEDCDAGRNCMKKKEEGNDKTTKSDRTI